MDVCVQFSYMGIHGVVKKGSHRRIGCVVDQQANIQVHGVLDDLFGGIHLRQVQLEALRPDPISGCKLGCEGFKKLKSSRHQDQVQAAPGKLAGILLTKSLRSAGDDRPASITIRKFHI